MTAKQKRYLKWREAERDRWFFVIAWLVFLLALAGSQ